MTDSSTEVILADQSRGNQKPYQNIGEVSCPSALIVGLDLTGSMQYAPNGRSLYEIQKESFGLALRQINENCSSSSGTIKNRVFFAALGVTDGAPKTVLPFASAAENLERMKNGEFDLPATPTCPGTDHVAFLNKATEYFRHKPTLSKGKRLSSFNVVLLISDGGHNVSDEEDVIAAAEELKSIYAEDGISKTLIMTVFVGHSNESADITNFSGVANPEQIEDEEERLMARIASEVPEELIKGRIRDLAPNLRAGSKMMLSGGADVMKVALGFIAAASSKRV